MLNTCSLLQMCMIFYFYLIIINNNIHVYALSYEGLNNALTWATLVLNRACLTGF